MQPRAEQTRRAILAAGREEFSSHGFDGGRVDRIAAAAGVNKQRIYAYFGDKEGLFADVLAAAFAELAREEEHLLELGANDVPRLAERVFDCYVGIHTRHPELWRLLAWENLEGGRHAARLEGAKQPVLSHLQALYEQGQASGHCAADIPFDGFIFTLFAVSYFMVSNRSTLRWSSGIDPALPEVQRRLRAAVAAQLGPRKTEGKGEPA